MAPVVPNLPGICVFVVGLVAALALLATPCNAAPRRVALVIGNSDYKHVEPLLNPANDARAIGTALIDAGFDRVDVRTNLDRSAMKKALSEFEAAADGADAAVIYFAGHGVQLHGENWLIPSDASLGGESAVPRQSVAMGDMIVALKRAKGARVLILDACRNNRFAEHWKQAEKDAAGRRIVVRGLSSAVANDVLIVYSAKAGTPALDGSGPNSPFAEVLSHRVAEPGVGLTRLFGEVRDDVMRVTGGRQEPSTYGAAGGDAYFVPPNPVITLQDAEGRGWADALSSDSTEGYRNYLQLFPEGHHWVDAAVFEAQRVADHVRRGATVFSGRTLRVYANGAGDYATVDLAVSAARAGDRIILGSGTYRIKPLTLFEPIFITGPPPGRAPAILTGFDSPTGALEHPLVAVRGGASWLQDVSVSCSCEALLVIGGAVTLLRDQLEQANIASSPGTRIDVIDSSVGGLQSGGEAFVVNNNVMKSMLSASSGKVVLLNNRMRAGESGVLAFSSTGRTVLEGNIIDARNLKANQPYQKFSLFYIRRADGRLVIWLNEFRLPKTFDETQWTQCVDTISCDVVLQDSRLSPN